MIRKPASLFDKIVKGFIGSVFFLIFVSVFVMPFGCGPGCMPDYSSGTRIGYVQKLSTKGLTYKSYEGELKMLVGDNSQTAEVFHFSIDPADTAVVSKMQLSMKTNERVEITYNQYLWKPWKYDTEYYVTGVVFVTK